MSSMLIANPTYCLVDRTKGSVANRIECSKEHIANNVKTLAGITAGVAGSSFLGSCINATNDMYEGLGKPDFEQLFKNSKGLEKVKAGIKMGVDKAHTAVTNLLKNPKAQQLIEKSDKWIDKITNGKLPAAHKGYKTAAAVTVVGAAIAIGVGIAKKLYKAGQIDQKYTDKAKLEKETNAAQSLTKTGRKYQTLAEKIATTAKGTVKVLNPKKADEYEEFMQAVVNARKY